MWTLRVRVSKAHLEFATDRLLSAGNRFSKCWRSIFHVQADHIENEPTHDNADYAEISENLSLADKEKELIQEALIKAQGQEKASSKGSGHF
jgi:hypothetical protein